MRELAKQAGDMAQTEQAIEIETGPQPAFAVIWLHGLGADGADFVPLVPELGLAPHPALRFVFPHAPQRAVTCNGGYVMRAWYDIVSLAPDNRVVDEDGLRASREIVHALIAREAARGIPPRRTFVAGFSQGGAVACLAALTYPERLAGLVALSTYIPAPALLAAEASPRNRDLPIFAAHGSFDDVVAPELGHRARDLLQDAGYPLAWHEYPMPHSVCIEEIEAIGGWLSAAIAAGGDVG
jgi:phospholipase/carboxylesterase